MDWRFYYRIADSGFAARRPKEPARRGCYPRPAVAGAVRVRNEFEISNWRFQRMEGAEFLVSSEASDFSPVRAIFHLFRPISQSQGIGFSPVTPNSPEKNVESRKQVQPAPRRQSLHPMLGMGMFLAKAGGARTQKVRDSSPRLLPVQRDRRNPTGNDAYRRLIIFGSRLVKRAFLNSVKSNRYRLSRR
jgi:hypothetical protein